LRLSSRFYGARMLVEDRVVVEERHSTDGVPAAADAPRYAMSTDNRARIRSASR
jgi:hypothetical protein